MITPSPTTKIDPTLARGTCLDIVAASATKPGHIVFGVPNTNYELHLQPTQNVQPAGIDKRLIGSIKAQARRLDLVRTGGRYIEPVFGRPRRVQGSVVSVDSAQNVVVVNAGVPIALTLTDPRQQASQFEAGQIVSCDVHDGATFTPKM
ncbi:MAG: hypothetical protein SFY96_05240 [Planctomycetota bacterium]|nr:hypothetical protein [Planctomycetota bacterium]